MMDVSIIIPAYNAASTIGLVLSALAHQDFPDFEVVVVDDSSEDDTTDIAAGFSDQLNLRLLRLSSNAGRAHARNCGVEESMGEIILLLDADIEVVPSYVSMHRDLYESELTVVGVGALKYPPPLARKAMGRYYSRRGAAQLDPGQPLPGRYFISGLASFRRSLFTRVGGFDEAFRFYGEDQELGLRFQKVGAHLLHLPNAVGYHHHLRPFDEILATLDKYGFEGIPLVLERHPEFARDLRLEDLTGNPPMSWFKGAIRRFAVNPLFNAPLAAFVKYFESYPLPSPLLTYLIYSAYRRGYIRYRRSVG
jgi:glycosyltransferase involved in cell wall biosynthesis